MWEIKRSYNRDVERKIVFWRKIRVRIWEKLDTIKGKNMGKLGGSQRQNVEVLQGAFHEPGSNERVEICAAARTGGSAFLRRIQGEPLFSLPPQFLHVVTPIWYKGIQGSRRLSRAVAPEGNQQKGRTLLQFLADHFYDIQALREYLLQRQTLKVHQKNR